MSAARRRLTIFAALVAFIAMSVGLVAAPAAAAEITAVLDVTKSVDKTAPVRGQVFTYTITVDCSSDDCVNAKVVDQIPAEYASFTLNPTVIVTGAPASYSWGGADGRTLTVSFTRALDAGGVGLASGDGPSIQVSLTVPSGLSPDWPSNGQVVSNTATVSADNALSKSASAPVTITVPYTVATTLGVNWAPPAAQFKVGEPSTITVTTRNTSNALASTLQVVAPTDPAAADNAFDIVDLTGLGDLVFPEGADQVQLDAYVDGAWVVGSPAGAATLPTLTGGATLSDITGLRITYSSSSGTTIAPGGTAGSLELQVAQRATNRDSGESLVLGDSVTLTARGTVTIPGHGTASANGSDGYMIQPLTVAVSGTTSFGASVIASGTGTTATLSGSNTSNGPVDLLRVSQRATELLSDNHLTFTRLVDTGSAWPDGATAAEITWIVDGGTAPASVSIAEGDGWPSTPSPSPGQRIVGFTVDFTGSIAAGETATIPFRFEVAPDIVTDPSDVLTLSNTAQIDAHNDAGDATPAFPSASMQVIYPQIDVALDKTVTPSAAVPPGGRSVTQLRASVGTQSGFVSPSTLVITDVDAPGIDYWDAFDVVAIAPTQVPAGAQLVIWTTTDTTSWSVFDTVVAGAVATTYATALPGGVRGVRFAFSDEDGFAQATSVQGNLAFVARATLRSTGDPVAGATPTSYPNAATVDAGGDVELPGGGTVSAGDGDAGSGPVKETPGNGGLQASKLWQLVAGSATVSSQSGQQRTARLGWGTEITGDATIVVTDPSDPTAAVSSTVFQAFDLVRIAPITASSDPYIAYDQVQDIRLYDGVAWTSIMSEACSVASHCQGRFDGYTLTGPERASTVAVEITFAEWAGGRGTSTTDPLSPPVGSGVASSPELRPLDLVFQLRNKLRDASATPGNPWITDERVYNRAPDAGLVENTVEVRAGADTVDASDSMMILDRPPGVGLTKSVSTPSLAIPVLGDVAASGYPTTNFVLTAKNTSDARAWYLRVTDQMPCSSSDITACVNETVGGVSGSTVDPYAGKTWNPATSPFDAFTITGITMPTTGQLQSAGVTGAAITVWNADGTTDAYSYDVSNGSGLPNATQLADAVGVSVLFTGVNSDGGTIVSGADLKVTLAAKLREFLRSDDTARPQPGAVTNSAFAQVWDGVLDDTGVEAYAAQSATVTLANAAIDVTATKTFAPTSLLESARTSDVTVTLGAARGSSTASPNRVTIEDTAAAFWSVFELRGLAPSSPVTLPSGATQARVLLDTPGGWVAGAWGATPSLPATTLSDVTGIRFEFRKADDSIFSNTTNVNWGSAQAKFVVGVRPGYSFGSANASIPNSVTTSATNPSWGTDTAVANASIGLNPGTFRVAISKTPAVTSSPAGETVDFTLIARNTGTGYLDNPVVVDQLPIDASMPFGGSLLYDPTSEITYVTSSGGILPVTGQSVAYDDALRRITITWPAGSRLAPGEEYKIVIPLQLAPGLRTVDPAALNTYTFSSDRSLAACTLATANGRNVTFSSGATSCRTDALVTTYDASAISSFKGVKGDVGTGTTSTRGATNVKNAATPCVSDVEGFYRQPCAANTVVGGTDLWKLQFINGGNIDASAASVVDVLPTPGDTYLRSGLPRASTFAPVFAGDVELQTAGESAGATMSWQVTTAANPCPSFETDAACSGVTWLDGATFPEADYDQVTAVRVSFDFAGATEGVLKPGATIAVTYRTVNTPTMTSGDHRAPVAASTTPAQAWNSFGVRAQFTNGDTRRVEPVRAGVELATGAIQATKAIAGVSAAFAPTSYSASATCTVAGVPVPLPSGGALTLAEANAVTYTDRIDGIPVGAVCRILEGATDAVSVDYVPAAPSGTGAELTVTTAGSVSEAVPVGQRATITNTFGTTSLTIVKAVETAATVGAFGPFDFTLACASDTGTGVVDVVLDPADAAFTLAGGAAKTVTGIPAPADCTLTETDSDGADRITVVTGSASDTVVEGEAAAIELGSDASYTTTVTNRYEAGTLSVRKVVTGGTSYADADFVFDVTCSYDGQTLLETSITLVADETHDFTQLFPAGTSCAVSETDAGGATDPADDATVIIPGPTGGASVGAVTAVMTNRFDTGSVRIQKSRTGDGAADFGAGPFTAQLSCTWERDGDVLTIPLPDGGEVVLNAANSYTATVSGLIAGASCAVTEPDSGAATATTLGTVPTVSDGGVVDVTITNRFDVAGLHIVKVRDGEGVTRWGAGPFTVEVECGYDRDGTWVDIDLGADATQQLTAGNGYEAQLDGLLVGAECTVSETDAGYAVASEVSTDAAPAVIPASGSATVTVTNTFLLGWLDIEKSASAAIVQGDDTFDYAIAVSNPGHIDAAGVQVEDDLDIDLAYASIEAPGWTCAVSGEDADGYGGTLDCDLDTVLSAGDDASDIVITVTVRPEIDKDELPNAATVSSTTPQVDGDDDDIVTPVKWLDVTASPQCLRDAPWLYYEVDARNVDLDGEDLTVEWNAPDGTVVHTDIVPITPDLLDVDGVIHGRLLWPGATIDTDEYGIGWPGYRPRLAGETPDYEELVFDATLPEAALRDAGSTVTLSINPTTTVAVSYPPQSASCPDTLGPRDAGLWIDKTANRTMLASGDSFGYTIVGGNDGYGAAQDVVLEDPIPATLQVLSVMPAVPSAASDPAWTDCEVTGRDTDGYGGVLVCELDRPLGVGERTPAVELAVRLSPQAALGTIVNVAELRGVEVEADPIRAVDLPTLAVDDDALVLSLGLPDTGVENVVLGTLAGLAALVLGLLALLATRIRRRRRDS